MLLLILASVLWSVSFALIGQSGIDPDLLAAARLGLAAVLFLPALIASRRVPTLESHEPAPRWPSVLRSARRAPRADHSRAPRWHRLLAIGALQFGIMYVLVLRSYQYLKGHEVALLTITTPLFVVLVESLIARRSSVRPWVGAAVAVCGAYVLRRADPGGAGEVNRASEFWTGFALVQLANLAFAAGQVLYRREEAPSGTGDLSASQSAARFGLLYIGAFFVALPWAVLHVDPGALRLTQGQLWTVLYLGVVPSGLAFFLWNLGATKVSVGALAVMNNLKIPLAVIVALLPPFLEEADLPRLRDSSLLFAAALIIVLYPSPRGGGDPSGSAQVTP